jgi:RnfABCDGE-type electron transport complex B subunit
MLILNALAAVAGLTFILATLLVLANRWLRVPEDPRVDVVEGMLPHTNCGACGYPGCRALAEALVARQALPGKCSVATAADHDRIAAYLGVEAGTQERQVARLACAGGDQVARSRAHYEGIPTCAAAAAVSGGGKACFWGCLGWGDCQRVCDFDAIEMDPHRLPVVDEDRCTGCGDCVRCCPKDLFSLHPASDRLWVACSSLAHGDEILADCEVACTGCGRCASDAPEIIHMHNHLPVIDYSKQPQSDAPTQRCPTGAIVWLDPVAGIVKGAAARKIVRHDPIRNAAT